MAGIENKIEGLLSRGQRVYYSAAPLYSPDDPYVLLGVTITYGTAEIGIRNQFVANTA
jgi:hypothetical protein